MDHSIDPKSGNVLPAAQIGAGASPSRHARKLAALDLQLRQQGAVIEELKLKVRHATDRAEADERLLVEQAGLLVKVSRDLRMAVDELKRLVGEAAGE
mgnify:CR=1 FL=1